MTKTDGKGDQRKGTGAKSFVKEGVTPAKSYGSDKNLYQDQTSKGKAAGKKSKIPQNISREGTSREADPDKRKD